MPSCLEVLEIAYRRAGIIPFGKELLGPELEVGLQSLKDQYVSWATTGMFGVLIPVWRNGEGAYEAKENESISYTTGDTITLPTQIMGVDGRYRTPEEGKFVFLINRADGTFVRRVYDRMKAEWIDIASLTQNSYAPLSATFDEQLKYIMAARLADETGIEMSRMLTQMARNAKMAIASRFGQPRRKDVGSYM